MPSLKTHCAISKVRTKGAYDFKELHKWIDDPYKKYSYNHRIKRHAFNEKDRDTIKQYWDNKKGKGWGSKAVVEWLFHISLDNLETAFKVSKKVYKDNTYNYFEFGLNPSGYIHCDFDIVDDLDELFDQDPYYDEDDDSFLKKLLRDIF